jgi:hypothetical protein
MCGAPTDDRDHLIGRPMSSEVAVLDALDESAVDAHAQAVTAKAGGIDVSLNLVNRGDVQGTPLIDMTAADLSGAPAIPSSGHSSSTCCASRTAPSRGSPPSAPPSSPSSASRRRSDA